MPDNASEGSIFLSSPYTYGSIVPPYHLHFILTLLHSERPKLYSVLAILSAIGLNVDTEKIHDFHISVIFVSRVILNQQLFRISLSLRQSFFPFQNQSQLSRSVL